VTLDKRNSVYYIAFQTILQKGAVMKIGTYLPLILILLSACEIKEDKIEFPTEPNRYSVPNPPSNLVVVPDSTGLFATLQWQDNSDNEDGFRFGFYDTNDSPRYDSYSTTPENAISSAGWFVKWGQGLPYQNPAYGPVTYFVYAYNRGGDSPKIIVNDR
jgi:hypothetical protein